jgi:GT2 family glycosyltransferase
VTAELSVVIPTHQRRDLLLKVLAALAAQTLEPARFEVVVVCDGCDDGSAAAARTATAAGGTMAGLRLEVLEQANSGAATARNQGARHARAGLLLFLDDDMIAAPDLLARHLRQHADQAGAIVIGNLPVHPDSPRSFLTVGLARWVDRRHDLLSQPGAVIPADEILTGQMSMSRETFNRLGGFDVRFTAGGTFGGEDIELGWRARHLEISVIYAAGAVSQQVYRKTFPALCRNIRDAAAADTLMAATHPDMRPHLPLGQIATLPRAQRLALNGTLRRPGLWTWIMRPLLAALDRAAARGATGRGWEHLHGIARAHLYGLGMLDGAAAASSSPAASSRTA